MPSSFEPSGQGGRKGRKSSKRKSSDPVAESTAPIVGTHDEPQPSQNRRDEGLTSNRGQLDNDASATEDYFKTMEVLDGSKRLSGRIMREATKYEFRNQESRDSRPTLGSLALLCGALEAGRDSSARRFSPGVLYNWLAENSSASQVDAFLARHQDSKGINKDRIVLQSAHAVIQGARSHARATIKKDQFSAHHLIAALVTTVEPSLRAQVREEVGVDIAEFYPRLLEYIRSEVPLETNYWRLVLPLSRRAFLTHYASECNRRRPARY
jgi:hypothetical protein